MAQYVECYECNMIRKCKNKKEALEIQKLHRNVNGHIAVFVNKRSGKIQ